jgi:hypothetical protein
MNFVQRVRRAPAAAGQIRLQSVVARVRIRSGSHNRLISTDAARGEQNRRGVQHD